METFVGYIKTPQDALIVFEACRRGQLSRVQRRLSSKERLNIRSGSVFAWDEREAGMRRWTDGRTWSPSRVLGSFLTYRELDTKRRPRRPSSSSSSSQSSYLPISKAASSCSYKSGGLIKQSFSICTATNQKIHLISYYTKADIAAGRLTQPSQHPLLSHIKVPKGLYPELNPLDTSGGHSATLHNLRQDLSCSTVPPLTMEYHISTPTEVSTIATSSVSKTPVSPPLSLSSSPFSSDEDVTDLASPSFQPMMMPAQPPLLVQDINWCNLSSSEDKRQLQALQGQLRL